MQNVFSVMTEEDLEEALEFWGRTEGIGLTESDTPDQLKQCLSRNPGLSLVARDKDTLVATVLCGHDGRRGHLYHLAVRPEYRNQGIGRKLVEECLKKLAKIGILKCNIFLFSDNEAGKRFWTRCDWSTRTDLQILQRSTPHRR